MNHWLIYILICSALVTGCSRNPGGESAFRTKSSRWDFDEMFESDEEFVALEDTESLTEKAIPQPKEIPGSIGSGIPSLDRFKKAMGNLAQIFQNVYFNTDEHLLRRPEHLLVIDKVAEYLKKHPRTYISVGGHCDERGSESYNLALGTRRSNYVRVLLVQRGVNLNQIHSTSYGKESPLDKGHSTSSWAKNRRVEFKIYEK